MLSQEDAHLNQFGQGCVSYVVLIRVLLHGSAGFLESKTYSDKVNVSRCYLLSIRTMTPSALTKSPSQRTMPEIYIFISG